MVHPEILWKLQSIDSEIYAIKGNKNLKQLQKRLVEIKEQYDLLKNTIEQQIKKRDQNRSSIDGLNGELNAVELRLKTDGERLYQKGQSLKAIENIQKEMDAYKDRKDGIENKLLKLMESEEILDESIEKIKKSILSLRNEFNNIKTMYDMEKVKAAERIKELDEQREGIAKQIDEDILKQYSAIACKKSTAVSKVAEGICRECGGRLNAMLYDAVMKGNVINLCEHCGRILYYEQPMDKC